MAHVIIIDYDFNREDEDSTCYADIAAFMTKYYPNHKRPLFSCYAVKTSDATYEVRDKIKAAGLVDKDDIFLVNRLSEYFRGKFPPGFETWAKT